MATYTDNYSLTKPTFAEVADIRTINGNMDTIDDIMHASQVSLAEAYDQTKTYSAGDVVMYEFLMYKCKEDNVTGNWDATKWERTTAAETGGGGSVDFDLFGEASGNPASFADGSESALVECETEIVPVQDLHGYSKPWAGGTGKNKLPVSDSASYTIYTVNVTSNGEAITLNGTSTSNGGRNNKLSPNFTLPAGNYILSVTPISTCSICITKTSDISSVFQQTNDTVSFTLTEPTEMYLGVDLINGVTYDETVYPMIRLDGASSDWEPYTNICPISGHSSVTINVSPTNDTSQGVDTTIQLGQTVYGGTLNVLTGELTIDRAIITITSESQFTTFSADSTYGSLATIGTGGKIDNSNAMAISSMAIGISNNDRVSPDYVSLDRCYIDDNGRVRLRASKDVTISTKADMLARFLNAQVVYILATPQTVQLTPTVINTLLGQNYISSEDTEDIDVVYTKSTAPIIPNPTGTPTATLKKLGIEGTVFELEGGGGGSSSGIHYSTTEQVIGTWIDGKPLYQKSIAFDNTSSNNLSVDVVGLSIDTLVEMKIWDKNTGFQVNSYYNTAEDQVHAYYDETGYIHIRRGTAFAGTGYITIQYTKITD